MVGSHEMASLSTARASPCPIKHYGDLDLDMSRKKLDQMGAIKPFMS